MAENHILLLPRIDYYKWVRAVQKYALHFGVGLTSDTSKIGNKHLVTVVISENSYPREGDILQWIKMRFPAITIDPVEVESPEELFEVLEKRIETGERYGKLLSQRPGEDVLPKYPQDRLYLFWPTDYPTILQHFGENPEIFGQYGLPGHEGVDIRAPYNSNIYACADGEVYFVETGASRHNYGRQIRIRHANGYKTIYAHLERILVNVGDRVKARQLIGRANSSGNSSGHHLHLTLKKDQATANGETDYPKDILDPTPFLVFKDKESEVFKALSINGNGGMLNSYPWTRPCLVGVNSRIGGSMQEIDFAIIENARIEAVKIHSKTTTVTIKRLRELVPDLFILAKLSVPIGREPISPKKWLEATRVDLDRLYKLGIRYFDVQQSPNLQQHGWRTSWTSGEGFGQWWMAIAERLWVEFSEIKLGFPGVSPGGQVPGQRLDAKVFLDGADFAMARADWIGVNCYWTSETEMKEIEGGKYYEEIRKRYPEKLLFITEFGNVNHHINSHIKGMQYVKYYQSLRKEPGIAAAFSQVISASDGYDTLVWRTEKGEFTKIVEEVRKLKF